MEELTQQQKMIDMIVNELGTKIANLAVEDTVKNTTIKFLEEESKEHSETIHQQALRINELEETIKTLNNTIYELNNPYTCKNCTCEEDSDCTCTCDSNKCI